MNLPKDNCIQFTTSVKHNDKLEIKTSMLKLSLHNWMKH